MTPYSENSGVVAYAIHDTYIDVEMRSGSVYRYSEAVTGKDSVKEMKRLALAGKGLATYISKYARGAYERIV